MYQGYSAVHIITQGPVFRTFEFDSGFEFYLKLAVLDSWLKNWVFHTNELLSQLKSESELATFFSSAPVVTQDIEIWLKRLVYWHFSTFYSLFGVTKLISEWGSSEQVKRGTVKSGRPAKVGLSSKHKLDPDLTITCSIPYLLLHNNYYDCNLLISYWLMYLIHFDIWTFNH